LNGCAHVDFTEYNFDVIAQKYDPKKIVINNIDDFAFSGEELGLMRPRKYTEKRRLPFSSENPLKGKNNEYPLQERRADIPLCEEWILAENIGQNWFPFYGITIFARKFQSNEESLMMEEKFKNMPSSEIENLSKMLYYGFKSGMDINFIIFSKHPFIVEFVTGQFSGPGRKREHAARTRLYQNKRGLDFVRGNFDYFN
jgi:hypothetical protein